MCELSQEVLFDVVGILIFLVECGVKSLPLLVLVVNERVLVGLVDSFLSDLVVVFAVACRSMVGC